MPCTEVEREVEQDEDEDGSGGHGWISLGSGRLSRLVRRIASFPADAVQSTKQVLNELTLPGADAIRADARRFQQLVGSDTVKARAATLFTQGLQTRGLLELELGDRIESL
jgi:hypothetical protein